MEKGIYKEKKLSEHRLPAFKRAKHRNFAEKFLKKKKGKRLSPLIFFRFSD